MTLGFLMVIGGGVLGGASFWLRGSALFERLTGRGKTTADAVWACTMAALFAAAAAGRAEWWHPLAVAVGFFVGGRPPWWKSLRLCHDPDEKCCLCVWVRHTLRGFLWVVPAALSLDLLGYEGVWLVAAGGLVGPCYEAGWRTWPARATEVGEVLFGALIGAGIVAAGIA